MRAAIRAEQAFDYLRRASMALNRKVVDIATEISRTRVLPGLDNL